MDAVYHLMVDEAMCATIVSRYYQQRPWYGRPEYQMANVALVTTVICATLAIREPDGRLLSILLLVFGWVAAFFGLKAIRRVLVDHIHLAHFRESGDVLLCDEGLSGMSRSKEKWTLPWGAYSRAVRFSDGILLVRPRAIRWLPENALASGSIDDVVRLVQQKTIYATAPT